MTRFMKMAMLLSIFNDLHSKAMIIHEWFTNDPILDVRFKLAFDMEDF